MQVDNLEGWKRSARLEARAFTDSRTSQHVWLDVYVYAMKRGMSCGTRCLIGNYVIKSMIFT